MEDSSDKFVLFIIIIILMKKSLEGGKAMPSIAEVYQGHFEELHRGFSLFFGFYRLPTKRDCWQQNSNLGPASEEKNPYQLNLVGEFLVLNVP